MPPMSSSCARREAAMGIPEPSEVRAAIALFEKPREVCGE